MRRSANQSDLLRIPAVAVVLVALAATACVTRDKHAVVVDEWKGRLGKAVSEKEQLDRDSKAALASKDDEITALRAKLDETVKGAASEKAELSADLKARQAEIAALRKQRERIEKSLNQYRKLREAFEKMISAGKIKVYRRRGRIMVSLPSSVLFPSGKATLSRAGRRALAQVGGVLGQLPDRRFLVAGHTDNVPIRTAKFEDNWELSTERALVVTRFLIDNGMTPTNLAAAGYGEHDALRPNTNPTNKRRNRRIEIILMPNIDELPDIDE